MQYLMSKLSAIEKLLSQREVWLKVIFPAVFTFGVLPYINESNSEALSHQAVALVQLIVPLVGFVLMAFSGSSGADDLDIEDLVDVLINKLKDQ